MNDAVRSYALSAVSSVLLVLLVAPTSAHALTFDEVRAISALALHGAVGFFGGAGILVFVVGLIVYLTRLGTEHRAEGVHIMSLGIKILFYVVIGAILLRVVVE